MTQFRSTALIALGANLFHGDHAPERTLADAVAGLPAEGAVIRAVSRFFTTPCFPPGAGPDYVNAAIRVDTALPAGALLAALHRIEARFGRARAQRWGMRTLDLDLLAMGDRVLPDRATYARWAGLDPATQASAAPDRLILPHPRLHERGFVLVPLADIAPDWRHPVTGKSVAEMCAALPGAEIRGIRPL